MVVDAIAGLGYVANWHDMTAPVAYAERFGTAIQPLGHIWSLSIEEQMYLVTPLLIAWVGIRRAGWVALATVGLGLAVWWGSADAYLATPVRLVEVLGGAWLGVGIHRGRPVPGWLVRAAVPGAMAAVAAVVVVHDNDPMVFTWLLPVVAVLWTALLAGATVDGRFAKVMSNPALCWVGQRSYAIYLIHVPLIELTDWSPVVVAVTTLFLAELSHRAVETPVRSGRVRLRYVGGATVAVAGAVVGMLLINYQQPDVAATFERSMAEAPVRTVAPVVTTTPRSSTTVPSTTTGAPVPRMPESPRILVVGDSVAESLQPALTAFAESVGGELVPRAVAGCSPLFDDAMRWNLRFSPDPSGFVPAGYCRPSVGSLIAAAGPVDVVVMIDHGMMLADHQPVAGDPGVWISILDRPVRDALTESYGSWISQADEHGAVTVFFTLADGAVVLPEGIPPIPDRVERVAAHNQIVRSLAAAHPDTVVLVDSASAVESDAARYDRPDGVHFGEATGAVALIADFFAPLFSPLQ